MLDEQRIYFSVFKYENEREAVITEEPLLSCSNFKTWLIAVTWHQYDSEKRRFPAVIMSGKNMHNLM